MKIGRDRRSEEGLGREEGRVFVCVWGGGGRWMGRGARGGGQEGRVVTDGPPQNYISEGQNAVRLSGVTGSKSCDGEVTHRCVLRTRWNDTGQ